jgi:hypothetical protein
MQKAITPDEVLDEGDAVRGWRDPVDHGEALLRRRKPWYYDHEPRPGVSVIGARLSELAALR